MDFVITDPGRTAAFNAGVAGVKIEVTNFKVGSAFGYTPLLADVDLHGTVLWTGVPSGFTVIDPDTCEFLLEIPGDAGSFDFGEIGLYLNNGLCFAIATLPTLQQKIAQPGLGWNVIRIRARLQLVSIAPIIQWHIQHLTIGVLQEVPNYSHVPRPPASSSNAYIVHQGDEYGNDPLVTFSHDGTWDVSTHQYPVVRSGDKVVQSSTAASLTVVGNLPLPLVFPPGRFLIQATSGLQKGLVRVVTAITANSISWTPAFGAPLVPGADQFEILQSNLSVIESESSELGFFHALSVRAV